ncbi:Cytochrome c oxidase assembly protein cox19 [Mortierella alpina]|nr:Cytochrome c oxidase assembly protein cox19 [Mortierella alpina]
MKEYLVCLKENQNNNGKCRHLSKKYLSCRMEKGLMGNDSFKNLGFHDEDQDKSTNATDAPASSQSSTSSTPEGGRSQSSQKAAPVS